MPSSRGRRAAARRAAARRRRRIVGAVVAAAAALAGIVAWRAVADGADAAERPRVDAHGRDGSERIDRSGRLEISGEPHAYRITYRVETYAAGEHVTTRDEVAIRRPFDGRTTKGDADGGVRSEQSAALGELFVPKTSSSEASLLQTGPSIAPSDLRFGPILDDLLEAGAVAPLEWRRVLDTPCQVLRFGGPITAGTVVPLDDPGTEYADACVSERGLLLEEVWVTSGRVQRWRIAESMSTDDEARLPQAFVPAAADLPEPAPVDDGGGSFREVEPSSAYPAPFFVLDAPPAGAEHLGRWAVVAPTQVRENEEGERPRLGFVADVWRDGVDVVIIEQGSSTDRRRPFELGAGRRITVDAIGEGEAVLDLRTSEIRFPRKGGYFVRVRGTKPIAELEQIARSLRETPGGTGLVYLDERGGG